MTTTATDTDNAADFSHLPDVTFTDMNPANVEDFAIRSFEYFLGQTLYPGDPRRIMLTTLAAQMVQVLAKIDDTGKQNLLRYAGADTLPHLGALLDVTQLGAEHAETEIEFTIVEQRTGDYAVTIPAGTRVTPKDKQIYFATTESGTIQADETSVTLPVKALAPGPESNGLIPGQINVLVDSFEHAIQVRNTRTSSGGANVEDLEAYRKRILLAPERFTCAGPELAYMFHAMSAHSGLADVRPYSPTPGVCEVLLLLAGGRIPDEDGPECKAVDAALNPKNIRPLTDHVRVRPATAFDYDYRFTYYLTNDQAGDRDILHTNMTAAAAAFESWQLAKIGRDINDDKLKSICQAAKAKRIVAERVLARDADGAVTAAESMSHIELAGNQVARIAERSDRVIFGGLEDE